MTKVSEKAKKAQKEAIAQNINEVNNATKSIAERLKERAKAELEARNLVRAERKVETNVGKTSRVDFILWALWNADGEYIGTPSIIEIVKKGYLEAIAQSLMVSKYDAHGNVTKEGLNESDAMELAEKRIIEDVDFKLRKWNVVDASGNEIAKSVQNLEKEKNIMFDDVISVKPTYNRISWTKASAKEQGFDFTNDDEHMRNILSYGIDKATEMLHTKS